MPINAKWHQGHPMRKPATQAQRLAWHLAHAKHCGCRAIPKSLAVAAAAAQKRKR